MSDNKQLPADPAEFATYLRGRAQGHAPGYDIAIYARPAQWLALADALQGTPTKPTPPTQRQESQ